MSGTIASPADAIVLLYVLQGFTALIIVGVYLMALFESILGVPQACGSPVPSNPSEISVIVSILLDNERHRCLTYLDQNFDYLSTNFPELKFEIICVYRILQSNRELESIENELCSSSKWKSIRCHSSGGKSAQLNLAIGEARFNNLLLLDADALIHTIGVPTRDDGCMMTQGVNTIRNNDTLIGKIVEIETAIKYLLSHNFRYKTIGSTYFTGSNGILRKGDGNYDRFSEDTLVEDIDYSLNERLQGRTISYSTQMVTSELAPISIRSWWIQRERWTVGWIQVGLKYRRHLRSSSIGIYEMAYLFYAIWMRRIVFSISSLLFIAASLYMEAALAPITILLLQLSVSLGQVIALSNALQRTSLIRISLLSRCLYVLLFPAYEILKVALVIWTIARALFVRIEWRSTPRDA
jgi:cellulose synthase/poly-beta-1,6-N-acetylglucosamine synthase-like glycosyltransferase